MFLFLSLYVIAVLAALIHLFFFLPAKRRTKPKVIEIVLLYQIVFSLGMTSLMAFYGFTFMPEYIASFTNWPACPFQQQMANVNLAFAVLGVLSIFYRGYFWMATIIGFSVWIIADGIHHVYHAIVEKNLSPGNIGVPLWTDFLVPILLLILLKYYMKTKSSLPPKETTQPQDL